MVMNKKETAAFKALQAENEALKLQIAGQSQTAIPNPFVWDYQSFNLQGEKVVKGWSFNAVLSTTSPYSVYPVWSIGHTHYGNAELRNGRQNSGVLYKTKAEALIAARAKLQEKFNAVMAQINKEIAREINV